MNFDHNSKKKTSSMMLDNYQIAGQITHINAHAKRFFHENKEVNRH